LQFLQIHDLNFRFTFWLKKISNFRFEKNLELLIKKCVYPKITDKQKQKLGTLGGASGAGEAAAKRPMASRASKITIVKIYPTTSHPPHPSVLDRFDGTSGFLGTFYYKH